MHLHVYKLNFQSLKKSHRKINLEDGNKVHKMLTEACNSTRAESKLLYRLVYRQDEVLLYVQTCKEIDHAVLESFGFCEVTTIDMQEKLQNIKEGDVVRFNIRVFPSKYEENGTKQYIKNEKERVGWIMHKFGEHGLLLTERSFLEKNTSMSIFVKNQKRTAIKSNEYEGYGIITDMEAFKQLVITGLGKCKNYGLGLALII